MKTTDAASTIALNRRSGRIRVRRGGWFWVLFGGLLAGLPATWGRTEAAGEQDPVRIRQVRVQGNQVVKTETILSRVESRAGAIFNEKRVAEDARQIINMPQITQVDWRGDIVDNQIDITFIVQESVSIKSVKFIGNKHIKDKNLLKELSFKADDFGDDYLIKLGAEALEEFYHKKGYYFAHVTGEKEFLESEGEVVYQIYEGPRVRINKVRFENNRFFSAGKLKRQIRTRSYLPILSKGHLDGEKLQQDCLALQAFYHDEGFLDAQVFSQQEFNQDQTRVKITFVIEEGVPYRVKELRFEGNQELSGADLGAVLTLEPGQILTHKRRVFAERAVQRAYGKEGYIYATAALEPEFTEQEGEVNVVFRIKEDLQYYLGRLLIQGNTKTQDKVIRRSFDYYGFTPGGLYNNEAKDRGADQLSLGLRIFESVNVTPIGNAPDERDALVTVTEADTGMLNFGVGVDTNQGVMGIFAFEQQNFDLAKPPGSVRELLTGQAFTGGGQRLRLQFSPGREITTGHLSLYEPYLLDQPYYMETNLMLFRRWWESHLETRRGGRITIGHRYESGLSADVSLRAEDVKVSDLEDVYGYGRRLITAPPDVQEVEGSNFLTSVRLGLGYQKTDNLYRPTEGYRLNTGWEQYGALGGEFCFSALSAGASVYRTVYMDLTERKTVWSGNVRGNYIIGEAPVFERYYAGGIGTLRGFDFRGVSPRGGIRDDPIGSNYLLLAGMELTHPFYEEIIYGKLFCDSGMVSEGPYRVTLGMGLELVIPGMYIPLQFNFGFPLIYDDKDEKEVFSFTMGITF